MNRIQIEIATDFSRSPAGRFVSDGPNSGERFRNQFLAPALKRGDFITVMMDGTRGYGSSFLEEAFGGLLRIGFDKDFLFKHINIISSDSSIVKEIERYWVVS